MLDISRENSYNKNIERGCDMQEKLKSLVIKARLTRYLITEIALIIIVIKYLIKTVGA